jgi:hypothetical protein
VAEARVDVQERVVVDVEAGVEAEARVERKGAHERARAIARLLEARGQRLRVARKAEAGVVAHAVLVRVQARQDVGVRGQRDDVVRVGALEAHALLRQPVQPRRLGLRLPVAAQRVEAQRVDRDQQHRSARARDERRAARQRE